MRHSIPLENFPFRSADRKLQIGVRSFMKQHTLSLVVLLVCTCAMADTFSYDDSGWLTGGAQSNGLVTSYGYDAEGNVSSALFSSTDLAPGGGAGNGMADWWENFFFDSTGIDPLERGDDGVPYLMKFALGIDPSLGDGTQLLPFTSLEGGNLSLVFRRSYLATNLVFVVQSSLDLVTWSTLQAETDAVLALPPLVSDADSASYKVSVPFSGDRLFLRLRVSKP